MKLSIVATLYQSVPYIMEFYPRCSAIARAFEGRGQCAWESKYPADS